ncbi:hypothetical protein L596_023610 [Steinernema carpocapsae]|uniref:Receptor ligand binding region domain-containing protein n=1 Tax=Steinernema carpocapsae TaxID=34508 RepID=A0A4U5ME74_STECR|nr:hypothetical protein L596_023610 [Steinernema carpocapsae]
MRVLPRFVSALLCVATVIHGQLLTAAPPPLVPPNQKPTTPPGPNEIRIGLLIPMDNQEIVRETGFVRSAGSIPIAIENVRQKHMLDAYNFTFYWKHDECDEAKAAGYTVEFIEQYQVHGILGPTCSGPAIQAGTIAAYYNVPIYFWGMVTAHALSEVGRFPTAMSLTADSLELAEAFMEIMRTYKWDRFAFIYMESVRQKCKYIRDDLNIVLEGASNTDINSAYSKKLENSSGEYVQKILEQAKSKARSRLRIGNSNLWPISVFAVCFDVDVDRRNFFLEVHDTNMDTEDYVYIMLDTRAYGFGQRAMKNGVVDSESFDPSYA